jgi:hypothetical protein
VFLVPQQQANEEGGKGASAHWPMCSGFVQDFEYGAELSIKEKEKGLKD